jgi:hypothetical protein
MMFADQANGAGLLPFLACFRDKPNIGADLQTVERIVENAVAMEIDFTSIGRLDEPIVFARQELRHAAMFLRFMGLHLTAHLTDCIFNLALGRGECIVDRCCEVLMLPFVAVRLGNENLLMPGYRDPNIDFEQIARPSPRLRRTTVTWQLVIRS